MSRIVKWLALPLLLVSCRELSVPPPPGPGFLTGRIVVAEPGTGRKRPAADVFVELNLTNLTTRTSAEGRFTLGPLPRRDGTLSLRLDADGDGRFERQRLIPLASLALPPSGDVSVGDLELTENALVRGRVLRADLPANGGGHGGTTVFVPTSPYTTTTADNGEFILRDLPDGELQLSAWRTGYATGGYSGIDLSPGQLLELAPISLSVQPPAGPASLRGTVLRAGSSAHGGLEVRLVSLRSMPNDPAAIVARATTNDDGAWAMPNLVGGLYDLEVAGTFTRLYNVFLPDAVETLAPELVVAEGQGAGSPPGPVQPPLELDGGVVVIPDAGVMDAGANQAPVIGVADVRTTTSGFVTLDARGTMDPENDALRFTWVQQTGPTVLLTLSDSPLASTTSFTAPATPGLLEFLLRVTDSKGAFSERTVRVTVNAPPVAVTAQSLVVVPGAQASLDGTRSFDPDRTGALSYRWSIVPEADGGVANVTLSSLTVAQPTFTAPGAGTVFRASLVVNDGEVDSTPAVTLVYSSSANVPPVAVAGPDLDADWNEALVLDGRGSFDPNGTGFSYAWRFVAGSTPCGTVADAGTVGTAIYTAPNGSCSANLRLTVTDPSSASGTADLTVRVSDKLAPQVASTAPSSPSAAFAPVQFVFGRVIDSDALPAITVRQADGGTIVGTVTWDAPSRTLSFAPRAPWPEAEPLVATMGAARSTAAVMMDGGATHSFNAQPPLLTPEVLRVGPNQASQPFSNVTLAAGPNQKWMAYKPTGNSPNWRRQVTNVATETENQMTGFGDPSESSRLKVEPLSTFANGFAFWSNMSTAEGSCNAGRGADAVIFRGVGPLTNSTFSAFSLTVFGSSPPTTPCSTVRSVSSAIDRDLAVLAATTVESGGAWEVRLHRCVKCMDPTVTSINGSVDWAAMPGFAASVNDSYTSVTMDARSRSPVLAWITQTGTGRRRLHGATFDLATNTWMRMQRDGSDDLNGATGDASAPVVRWRGNEPMIVWLQSESGVTSLRAIQRSGTTWIDLGGNLNGGAPLPERPRLELINETPFVSWTEPVGAGKPHVAWFDERRNAWRAPQGTGMDGEIVLATTCNGTAPALAAQPDAQGLVLAYPVVCLTPSSATVQQREIR